MKPTPQYLKAGDRITLGIEGLSSQLYSTLPARCLPPLPNFT
jgi:hypothetical protein